MLAQYQSGAQTRRVRSLPDDGPFVELHPLLAGRLGVATGERPAYGDRDGVAGYGVMAVTFDSGHILGLRNWTSTSAGTPMKSIWHRFPDGRWEFVEEGAACPLTCSVWFGPGAPARHEAGSPYVGGAVARHVMKRHNLRSVGKRRIAIPSP